MLYMRIFPMSSIIGDRSQNVDFPQEPTRGKKRGARDEASSPDRVQAKAQKTISEIHGQERPSTKSDKWHNKPKSILKSDGASESAKKKRVRVEEEVLHRQTFGATRRHGRYSERTKQQKLPLVDESSKNFQDVPYETFEAQKAKVVEWKKLPPALRPVGANSVGSRESEELTEKRLTARGDTKIKKLTSPSWKEPDLKELYQVACDHLSKTKQELSTKAIQVQMVIEARERCKRTDVCTLDELKGIYLSLYGDEFYTVTEEDPGTPPDAVERLKIAEHVMLPELMDNMRDIISIEKNEDQTFSVSYSQISERDIIRFLHEMNHQISDKG